MYTYVVIDDERLIRLGLISRVKEIQSETFLCIGEAANGAEGLKVVEELRPDIVITDMKMTKMDGVEFLERLTESYPQIPVIVISGYKAFDYMNQAIERGVVGYLLKPFSTEEIEKQLLKAKARLEQQKSVASLQEKVDSFEKRIEGNEILKLILEQWNEETSDNGRYALDRYHILVNVCTNKEESWQMVCKFGMSSFSESECLYLENPAFRGQYFMVFSSRSEPSIRQTESRIQGFFELIRKKIKTSKLFVAVSRRIHGLAGLHEAYQKNEKMLREIYLTDKFRIFYEASFEKCIRRIFSDDELQDIMVGLKYNSEISKYLREDFFGRFSIETDNLQEIGNSCKRLLAKVDEWAVKNQVETDDIMNVFYRRYRFSEDLKKMQKEICGYISLIYMSVQRKNFGDEYLYEEMISYIRENYYKKITLQTLADQFYISAVQCSNLLKKKMEKGLNTYLMEIRINKAKELLEGTSMSVEQISREIGYPNPKYFFRMFKQITTLTPNEYRNRRK